MKKIYCLTVRIVFERILLLYHIHGAGNEVNSGVMARPLVEMIQRWRKANISVSTIFFIEKFVICSPTTKAVLTPYAARPLILAFVF